MNNEENFAVNIERTFDAPVNKVWQAWVDGEIMKKWSCPNGFEIIEHSGEAKVGSNYSVTMKSEFYSGTVVGKYLEISKPNKLVMSHCWDNEDGTFTAETIITVLLEDLRDKTKMNFTQTGFENSKRCDSHHSGWTETFDKLEVLLK